MDHDDLPATDWWAVELLTDPEHRDLVADRLLLSGAMGVEEADEAGRIRLRTGFPDESGARRAAAAIIDLVGDVRVRHVVDDGLDAWREHARVEVTDRFVLVPAWLAPVEDDRREVIILEPGRTFGSGSHPTTRACLDVLADEIRRGDRVLDVGTGSGVLAVAAGRRGATGIVAIDIEPTSPDIVRANAVRNHVEDPIDPSTRPLAEVADLEPPFHLVVANLLAPVVRENAADLARCVRAGGSLIASGLLDAQADEAVTVLTAHGLVHVRTRSDEGWSTVLLRKPPSSPVPC